MSGRRIQRQTVCEMSRAEALLGRRVAQQRLGFQIFVETKLAPLAAVAAFLVAAKRGIEVESIIDRHPACAYLAGDRAHLLEIGARDIAREAELRVVGY